MIENALSKIREYNAAMELPYSALLGIAAVSRSSSVRDVDLVKTELKTSAALCRIAEQALSRPRPITPRRDIHFHVAMQHLFQSAEDRQRFLDLVIRARHVFEDIIKQINSKARVAAADPAVLSELSRGFNELSERIRRDIPREAYLASLTGNVRPGSMMRGD